MDGYYAVVRLHGDIGFLFRFLLVFLFVFFLALIGFILDEWTCFGALFLS